MSHGGLLDCYRDLLYVVDLLVLSLVRDIPSGRKLVERCLENAVLGARWLIHFLFFQQLSNVLRHFVDRASVTLNQKVVSVLQPHWNNVAAGSHIISSCVVEKGW